MTRTTIGTRLGILTLTGMVALSSAALAQGHRGRGDGPKHDRMEKAIERLNLTDQQKAQMQSLRDRFQTENAATLERVKALRSQMQEQRKSGNSETAQATRSQMKSEMEKLKAARESMHAEMKSILTPEQISEMEKMKAERKGKMKNRRGERGKKGRQGNGTAQPQPGQSLR